MEQFPQGYLTNLNVTRETILQHSGWGSVGRVVASNSIGLWFESSHRQKIILNVYCQLYWKDENKERGRELRIF